MAKEIDLNEEDLTVNIGNTTAALHAGQRIGELEAPKVIEIGGVPHLFSPEGLEATPLNHLLPAPLRIAETRQFEDPESFCEYVQDFADGGTRLYGSIGGGTIRATLDDHESAAKPRHGDHHAILRLQPSLEWATWTDAHKRPMDQREFCEFLEENITSVASPEAADILEATGKFTVKRQVNVKSVISEGGNVSFALADNTEGSTASDKATLPREFVLGLRPFKVSEPYKVTALLRYRYSEGKGLIFNFALREPERVREAAFMDVRRRVEETCSATVLI